MPYVVYCLGGACLGLLLSLWEVLRLRRICARQQAQVNDHLKRPTPEAPSAEALIAAERDALLGRLAGRVAHEVNNPLEAIKIYIEPLRRRVADRPEVDHGLVVIDQQVDRIASLVRGLLGFVRQRAPHATPLEVREVIHSVVELLRPRFAKRGTRLDLALTEPLCGGTMDADGLQQVLLNLLENALAAAPAGGWVRLEGTCHDGAVHLTISDNGPGLGPFPEAHFRPFVTTKSDGTGLGLTIARRICEAHGGHLIGRNRDAGGAQFDLMLNLHRSSGHS